MTTTDLSSHDRDYWMRVVEGDFAVPGDLPLDDLTAELTGMLGSPDPERRDTIAYPMLATWIGRGVYDDLLTGLGDGMAAGLAVGLGEDGTDSVFRRSFSALVLAECLQRDTDQQLLPAAKVLDWGDKAMSWLVRERDTRGHVQDHGWAHAVAHGADAVGVLAGSPHLAEPELVALLDVLAERAMATGSAHLVAGEPDRLAMAVMRVVRRDLVGLDVLEQWVARLADGAEATDPAPGAGNAQAFLRALWLHLSLGQHRPAVRTDLLLVVVDALRTTNAAFL